jgi:predicted transcriptional regulator
MATTVRVDDRLHAKLRELADAEHRPIGQVIEDAIARYEREKFWQEIEASVERLRGDQAGWQDYQAEIAFLEGGSMDRLEDEEPYYSPQEEAEIRAEHARAQGG